MTDWQSAPFSSGFRCVTAVTLPNPYPACSFPISFRGLLMALVGEFRLIHALKGARETHSGNLHRPPLMSWAFFKLLDERMQGVEHSMQFVLTRHYTPADLG